MSDFTITAAHNNARLAATLAYADAGPEKSRIEFYDANDVRLGTAVLAKPCGAVVADALTLVQLDPANDLVVTSGAAARAAWIAGNNTLVAVGTVTDETGAGPFILQGAAGTQLYAGGRLILGATRIT